MAVCNTTCGATLPPLNVGACGIEPQKGGIEYFIFTSCDVTFTDPCDIAEWATPVSECKVRIKGPLLAQKTAGSTTKARFSSCTAERVTGKIQTWTFSDYSDDRDFATDRAFWNQVQLTPDKFRFGYVTCDGMVWGLEEVSDGVFQFSEFSLEINDIIPETSEESSRFEGTVEVNQLELFYPRPIDGLIDLLTENQGYNCETTGYGEYTTVCAE